MGVEVATSVGSAVSVFEGARATFTSVGMLDSGPIGGWGPGLASLEPVSFSSRNAVSNSSVEGLSMFNLTDQTIFNSQSNLNAVDAVLEAESILAQAAKPQIGNVDTWAKYPETSIATLVAIYGQPEVLEVASAHLGGEAELSPGTHLERGLIAQRGVLSYEPVIFPQAEPKIAPVPTTQVVVRPQTMAVALAEEQEVNVAEETVVGNEQEEIKEIKLREEETVEQVKALHVIDRKAAARRITKILARALLVIAGLTSPQKIKGADLTIGLPSSNKQEIRGGEINRKDPEEKLPDKTWDATIEQLDGLEFDSIEQIKTQVPSIVLDNHPVAVATKGEVASDKNVVKSHDNKAPQPHLICEIRRKLKKEQRSKISKSSQQPAQILVEEKQVTEEEKPIQAHPELAEALKAGKIWG